MKTIAWHLVGSPLILAIMTIIRSCLCSNLRAERAKNVLSPELAPRLIHQPAVTTEPHFTCGTPSPCHLHVSLLAQALISVQWNLPSWEPRAWLLACLSLPFALPDAHFPWESRLLRTAAAAIPACSCCLKTGQQGSVVLPLRTDFFFHLSLKILSDCANCGHSVSCPLSVPDASAWGPSVLTLQLSHTLQTATQ